MGFGSEPEGPRLVRRGNRSRGTQGCDQAGPGVITAGAWKGSILSVIVHSDFVRGVIYAQTPIDHL
jgi:hypothetical protein